MVVPQYCDHHPMKTLAKDPATVVACAILAHCGVNKGCLVNTPPLEINTHA